MDNDIKTKFLKTSELYLKITDRNAKASNIENITELVFLERKMSNRFFHNTKSVLLDKIS